MADIATNWVDSTGMIENAAYLNSVGTAINANTHARPIADTYANRPSASSVTAGTLYFCTDTDTVYKSDGSSTWSKIRIGGAANASMADPPSTGLSYSTLGSATFTADKGDRLLTMPSAGDNQRVEYKALPATPWTVTACLECNLAWANYSNGGIYLRSSGGAYLTWGPGYHSGYLGNFGIESLYFSSETAGGTNNFAWGSGSLAGTPKWWRIRDDGTTRYFDVSYNGGVDWVQMSSQSNTTNLTAAYVGWGGDNNASGATAYVRCRSFKVA